MEDDSNTLKSIINTSSRISFQAYWYSHAAKRLMDILTSALGLLLLAPFFAFLGGMIKRDSPGPVFYRGPRMGREGRAPLQDPQVPHRARRTHQL